MAIKKKVKTIVKVQLAAGKANPSPPVGPALGQHGVNIMEFCKSFNAKTKDKGDTIIPVVITIYQDKSFDFILKAPPASVLIKKAIKLEKGSGNSVNDRVGTITKKELEEIAQIKMPDLNAYTIEAAVNIIKGTARSMGVYVS